jgi:hypothetical protein
MAGSIAKLGAVSLFIALGTVMVPGTGRGGDARTEPERAAPAPEEHGEGQKADGTPALAPEEEEAARAALEDADPRELARTSLMAEYASSTLERLVRADAGDPEKLDEATLGRLVGKYMPVALCEAEQWGRGIDPSTIPLARIIPKNECTRKYERFKCSYTEICDFEDGKGNASCQVTNCGEGVCPACPHFWNLDGLIVHGWCTYGCSRDKMLVGTKIVLHWAINKTYDKCFKLDKPEPLDP